MPKAVIMAGGKGQRLSGMTKAFPKPMILIQGKPVLQYQIENLKCSGIEDIIIVVGYLGNSIIDYFKDGKQFGVSIKYIKESKPLGTAGALFYLKNMIDDNFFLIYGDLMLDVDWNQFMNYHVRKNGIITLFTHPNSHPFDSDVVLTNIDGRVTGILNKNDERKCYYRNEVNAGLYCVNPAILDMMERPLRLDMEKDIIWKLIENERVYAYKSTEYVKDMGTPDRLVSVIRDQDVGIPASRNLKKKQHAIFLDRDGTINKYKGFIKSNNDFELIQGVSDSIKLINNSKYLVIVVTNQPVIARGECSPLELEIIHQKMETELGKSGAYLDDVFYCPHHPDKGFDGEILELKIECNCRKPRIGMLKAASEKHNIDLEGSWIIGDSTIDIQTGINAGMSTILLKTGMSGNDGKYDVKADYIAKSLSDAVKHILGIQYEAMEGEFNGLQA